MGARAGLLVMLERSRHAALERAARMRAGVVSPHTRSLLRPLVPAAGPERLPWACGTGPVSPPLRTAGAAGAAGGSPLRFPCRAAAKAGVGGFALATGECAEQRPAEAPRRRSLLPGSSEEMRHWEGWQGIGPLGRHPSASVGFSSRAAGPRWRAGPVGARREPQALPEAPARAAVCNGQLPAATLFCLPSDEAQGSLTF